MLRYSLLAFAAIRPFSFYSGLKSEFIHCLPTRSDYSPWIMQGMMRWLDKLPLSHEIRQASELSLPKSLVKFLPRVIYKCVRNAFSFTHSEVVHLHPPNYVKIEKQ